MKGMVCFFFAIVLACSTVNAGPYYPYAFKPYGAIGNYVYNTAPVAPLAAPVAPVSPFAVPAPVSPFVAPAPVSPFVAPAPVAAVPNVLGNYYSNAAAAALAYPGYAYNYPYFGAYTGYSLLKK